MSCEQTLVKQQPEAVSSETGTKSRPTFRPAADIRETEHGYELVVDVPGASEEDIDLSLTKDELTIQAGVAEPSFDGYELVGRGYGVGDYRRTFRIGEGIDRDGVTAEVKDGVLRVTVPKAREALTQKINVKRAE